MDLEHGWNWNSWKARPLVNPTEASIYRQSVKLSDLVKVDSDEELIFEKNHFHKFNLSFIAMNNKLECVYRNSDFLPKQNARGHSSHVSTGEISGNRVINSEKIRYRGYGIRLWDSYNGFEDPKIFLWRGARWCLFARPNYQITRIRMVLLNLDNGTSLILNDPEGRPYTKNWMPYVQDDRLLFVIDLSPLKVYELDDDKLVLIENYDFSIGSVILHGGSNLIQFDSKLVGLVHGCFEISDGYWFYWHAVASWSNNFKDMRIGRPFYFSMPQIEFSLCIVENNGKIMIPYSVMDSGVSIVTMDHDEFRKLL